MSALLNLPLLGAATEEAAPVTLLEPSALLEPAPVRALASLVAEPSQYLPVPVDYARVYSPMPVYSSLDDIRAGNVRTFRGGQGVWVSVLGSRQVGGETYYRVRWNWNELGWMAGDALSFEAQLSRLRGVDLRFDARLATLPGADPRLPLNQDLAMVYVPSLNVRSMPGIVEEETQLDSLQRYDLVAVLEEQRVNDTVWYRIGENRWIHSGYVRHLRPGPRPDGVGEDEKWIEVNVNEQIIIAHEGDTPVYATLTSTGRPGAETVLGLYRIWVKLSYAPMAIPTAGYDLADVPFVMYFHEGYGVHGGYWHDNYGTVQSDGCVNLSPYDARWFFEWAEPPLEEGAREVQPDEDEPGTWVYVWE